MRRRVNQRPRDDTRENFAGADFVQQIGEWSRSAIRARQIQLAAARKFWGDDSICSARQLPVEAVNFFDRNDLAQRLNGESGLGAGAAIIFAAQANWLLRWREAMARAGREGESDFRLSQRKFSEATGRANQI